MSPAPLARLQAQRRHRIAECSFSLGFVVCEGCGARIEVAGDPTFDRDVALAEAWLGHRREVGQEPSKQGLGYFNDGRNQNFKVMP